MDLSRPSWRYALTVRSVPAGRSPRGPNRVNRGGSWYYPAVNLRVADRLGDHPSNRFFYLGFRLARTLP